MTVGELREIMYEVLGELPPEVRRFVKSRVAFEARPKPTPADLERGAKPDDRGYFYGLRVRGDDEDDDADVLEADDDDDVAQSPEYRPGGLIVLFPGNVHPCSREALAEVLRHELAHFLGEDEDQAAELGLGDIDEDGTVVEVEDIE